MILLAWLFFTLGALLCGLNFYLSFLRFPIYRLRGHSAESYRWSSGIPLFGSLFVAVTLFFLSSVPWILIVGILLIALDTGGIHWFIYSQIRDTFIQRKKS